MKTIRIFLLVLIIIGIVLLFTQKFWIPKLVDKIIMNESTPTAPMETSSIKGCYVAKLAKDVYTLNIKSENGGVVTGMLAYNNFEKDSSSGRFDGTFKDSILLGNYSFDSEGMHSNRQVIFKKVGNDFVQGFGPVEVVGDRETFKDVSQVTYDPKLTFLKSVNCMEILQTQININ